METKLRKTIELKSASIDEQGNGYFEGYASIFGVVDSYNEIVDKGAFEKHNEEFLRHGFIAWGHDWNNPIAVPISSEEDALGWKVKAEFHSHETAQNVRKIMQERLARGKSVRMSFGYAVKGDYTDENGVRHLTEVYPYEASIVTVPANPLASVTDAKSLAGLRLEEQHDTTLAVVREYQERIKSLNETRRKEGRTLNATNKNRIQGTIDVLQSVVKDLQTMLEESEKSAPDHNLVARMLEAEALYNEFQSMRIA